MIKFTSAKRYNNFKDRLRFNGMNLYETKTRQNYLVYKIERTVVDNIKIKSNKVYIAKIKRHIYDKYKAKRKKKLHEEFKFLYEIQNVNFDSISVVFPSLPTDNM